MGRKTQRQQQQQLLSYCFHPIDNTLNSTKRGKGMWWCGVCVRRSLLISAHMWSVWCGLLFAAIRISYVICEERTTKYFTPSAVCVIEVHVMCVCVCVCAVCVCLAPVGKPAWFSMSIAQTHIHYKQLGILRYCICVRLVGRSRCL